MSKLNRDEIYMICMRLDINSILRFSLVNKNMREKIVCNVLKYKLNRQYYISALENSLLRTKPGLSSIPFI